LRSRLGKDLNRRRGTFDQQLKDWNETYDQMLNEIDFSMDRPVHGRPSLAAQIAVIGPSGPCGRPP
jgi:hypothetical protein